MKKTLLALTMALSMAAPAFAQGFAMGEDTKGLKVKVSDDTDFSIRLRMQPRFDTGDLIASKDGKSYESETDMYLRRIRLEKDAKDGKVFKTDPLYVARVEVSPPGFTEKSKSDAWLGQGQHLTFGLSYAAQKSIDYSYYGTTNETKTHDAKSDVSVIRS